MDPNLLVFWIFFSDILQVKSLLHPLCLTPKGLLILVVKLIYTQRERERESLFSTDNQFKCQGRSLEDTIFPFGAFLKELSVVLELG